MAPRIEKMTDSCGECDFYSRVSGGLYECIKVRQPVIYKEIVAPFCPLPLYPAPIIADMQITILGLQKSVDYGFPLALFTFVAAKLKRTVSANGSTIVISCRDGESVTLRYDYIREVTLNPFTIRFQDNDKAYALCVDGIRGPSLTEVVISKGEALLRDLYIVA